MRRFALDRLPEVFDLVGNTPILPVKVSSPSGREVWVDLKLEGSNPSGSVKDRAAVQILKDLVRQGRITRDSVLLDASSGNMASAFALFGRALGIQVAMVCNPSLTAEKRAFMCLLGARLINSELGPYTADAYRVCQRMLAEDRSDRYVFADQLHNTANPLAHELTTAPEILSQRPEVEFIVGSLGSGGTMTGIGRHIAKSGSSVKVVAVSSSRGSRFPGVGAFEDGDEKTPFILEAERDGLFTERVLVSRLQVKGIMGQLLTGGIPVGTQTAAVASAAVEIAERYDVEGGIVAVSGDAAWKNIESITDLVGAQFQSFME